jgi:hypothetical protein
MSRFDSQRNGQGLIIFLHSTHSSGPIRPVIPRFQAVTKKKEVRNPAIVRYAGRDRASTGITRNCNYKPNYFRQIELSSKSDLTTHYSAFKDRTKPAGVCSELLRCDPFVLHLLLQRPKLKHRMSNKNHRACTRHRKSEVKRNRTGKEQPLRVKYRNEPVSGGRRNLRNTLRPVKSILARFSDYFDSLGTPLGCFPPKPKAGQEPATIRQSRART